MPAVDSPKQKEIVANVAKVFLLKTPRRTTATNVFLDHADGVAIVAVRVGSSRRAVLDIQRELTRLVDGGCRNSAER